MTTSSTVLNGADAQRVGPSSCQRRAIDTMAQPDALLDIDARAFAENFDRRPFLIGHRLCDHPLFALERVLGLAKALPASSVEYNAGDLPIGCDPSDTPRTGLSVEDTIKRIEDCRSWMVLKNVEADPEYRALLARCLSEVEVHSEPLLPGATHPEAFIFLSSPGSITPYHMDPEHNFLLQIRGSKQMTLFDREIVPEEQRERFHRGAHRNMPFAQDYLERSVVVELQPGQAVHVPVALPHFVKNGAGVSISFSITFRTPDLYRRGEVHALNGMLRDRGFNPAPVGSHPSRDAMKSLTMRALRRTSRMLGVGEKAG